MYQCEIVGTIKSVSDVAALNGSSKTIPVALTDPGSLLDPGVEYSGELNTLRFDRHWTIAEVEGKQYRLIVTPVGEIHGFMGGAPVVKAFVGPAEELDIEAEGLSMLAVFSEVMSRKSFQWFPACGTLLSVIRDEWAPGDADDLDIYVHDADFGSILRFLDSTMFRTMDRFIYNGNIERVKLVMEGCAAHIDLSRLRNNTEGLFAERTESYTIGRVALNGKLAYCVDVYDHDEILPPTSPSDILFEETKYREFHGLTIPVPAHADRILEWRYGPDWRTPVPRSDWNWSEKIPSRAIVLEHFAL